MEIYLIIECGVIVLYENGIRKNRYSNKRHHIDVQKKKFLSNLWRSSTIGMSYEQYLASAMKMSVNGARDLISRVACQLVSSIGLLIILVGLGAMQKI